MANPLRKLRDHFLRDLINRINDLETGIRVVVSDPDYRHEARRGFNALRGRQRIFEELATAIAFANCVETGTFLGESTGFMATHTGRPVFSCERNPSLHALAKFRLKAVPQATLMLGDSRALLQELSRKPQVVEGDCFLYLDAHWGRDVPLNEEIEIVATRWKRFVIMIDDFEVPDDPGYTHGHYGTLKAIGMDGLRERHGLRAWFPTTPSREEWAGAPGNVVLAKEGPHGAVLDRMTSIRRHAG